MVKKHQPSNGTSSDSNVLSIFSARGPFCRSLQAGWQRTRWMLGDVQICTAVYSAASDYGTDSGFYL